MDFVSNLEDFSKKNTFHRIENTGDNELVFVEIQLGDDIKEDDIVRIEDDYGRI